MRLIPLAVIALSALIAVPVHAADQTILGAGFQVKNPGTPDKRKVQVKAKEKGSPNTIVGDPVTGGGATLTIRANGTTPSQQVIPLPQGFNAKGKPFWSGTAAKGFKYNDAKGEQGPVKKVQIKKSGSGVFALQAQASGKVMPLNVTPPNIGTDACAFLEISGGDSYSVKFTAGDGTITNKTTKEYSQKKVTIEGGCGPTCSDGIQNQGESDTDCGGPNCGDCPPATAASRERLHERRLFTGVCQTPTCSDGVKNGAETDLDCGGGTCIDCTLFKTCLGNSDCQSNFCSGSQCRCPNQAYTFTVNSNSGGVFDSAEWPGGTASQSAATGCSVAINRPNDNIDLVCSLAAPFSVNGFSGYSSCFGTGGEDGDGCQPISCPPAVSDPAATRGRRARRR